MARSDYAGILDRNAGKGEVLAGGVAVPVLDAMRGDTAVGRVRIEAPMMHGNRWPALYGGFLFDLAHRAGVLAVEAGAGDTIAAEPRSLEIHFLRAVRREDVPDPSGRVLSWSARMTKAGADHTAVAVDIGDEDALLAKAFGVFAVRARTVASHVSLPERLVLPCHDSGWSTGRISGRFAELPGSISAVSDTMLAKAAATVRGDGCPETHEEHFLARTLSYTWLEAVDDGLANYEARLIHRGRRLGLAAADVALESRVIGRVTGTIVFQQVPR